MVRTIKFELTLNASPQQVFDALMDSARHSAFTGGPAEIENRENGKFSLFNGMIGGLTTSMTPPNKIEQQWRAGNWEENYFSEIVWELREDQNKTTLLFTQTGVPDEHYELIKSGWDNNYVAKLPRYFEK